jgi:hypothetical protein
MRISVLLLLIFFMNSTVWAKECHLSVNGTEAGDGSAGNPFRNIQAAADIAQPGDVIPEHEGLHRERLNPPGGGESDFKRIVYRAARGKKVEIARAASGKDQPLVKADIDWPTFLARHDMLWKRLPGNWREAPWTGNGMLGSMLWIEGNALRIQVFRGDVQAHRPMTQGFSGYTRARLQIGSHYLAPAGKPTGCDLRLSYYDAEVIGAVNTEKGAWKIRHFTHAEDLAIVTELEVTPGEGPVQLTWQPDKNAMPTRGGYARTEQDLPRLQKQYKSRYPTEPFLPNPDAVVKKVAP